MTIGERLRQARKKQQLTQQQVADALHVSRKTISSWETGRSYPDVASLVGLSDLRAITTDLLLKGDAALLADLTRRAILLRRVRRLGWAAMAINLLLLIGFGANNSGLAGFSLGRYWTGLLIAVMVVNFLPLLGTELWQIQVQGTPPLVIALKNWILGIIGWAVICGGGFIACWRGLGAIWWWPVVWIGIYAAGCMGSFWWYGRSHHLFNRTGQ